jgi:hypothetical protein
MSVFHKSGQQSNKKTVPVTAADFKRYGFYSARAAAVAGSATIQTAAGKTVEITHVGGHAKEPPVNLWGDFRARGEIAEMLSDRIDHAKLAKAEWEIWWGEK